MDVMISCPHPHSNQDQNNQFVKQHPNRCLAHHNSKSVSAQNFAPRSYRPTPSPGTKHAVPQRRAASRSSAAPRRIQPREGVFGSRVGMKGGTLWSASEAYARGECATARMRTAARRSTPWRSISAAARSARWEAAASVLRGCLSLERARAASYSRERESAAAVNYFFYRYIYIYNN